MKFLILALALFGAVSAQNLGQQQPIAIVRQAQDISPDGSYNYAYETENGISVAENGSPGPVNEDGQASLVAQGNFAYTGPDGSPISVTYTADENGFHPEGAHLPVAPAIPAQIARALEFIAAHPPKEEQPSFGSASVPVPSRPASFPRPGQGFRQF